MLCVSTGRQATEKERTHGGVLKDMDLVMNKAKLHLGSKKAAFMVQVEKDAMFLAELNIMDYSLLVSRVFPQVQLKAPVSMSNNHIPC